MKNHLKEKTGSAPLAGSPSAAGSESHLTLSCRRFVDPAHPVLFSMWHWRQELCHEKALATECAGILDVCQRLQLLNEQHHTRGRELLIRIVSMLYCPRLGCVNLDWLRLCQIDPLPCLSHLGKGCVIRNGSLQFGFVSQSPNSQNLNGLSIIKMARR